jgi:hypothetical protein
MVITLEVIDSLLPVCREYIAVRAMKALVNLSKISVTTLRIRVQ